MEPLQDYRQFPVFDTNQLVPIGSRVLAPGCVSFIGNASRVGIAPSASLKGTVRASSTEMMPMGRVSLAVTKVFVLRADLVVSLVIRCST